MNLKLDELVDIIQKAIDNNSDKGDDAEIDLFESLEGPGEMPNKSKDPEKKCAADFILDMIAANIFAL